MSILCTHIVDHFGRQIVHDNGGQLPVEEISLGDLAQYKEVHGNGQDWFVSIG